MRIQFCGADRTVTGSSHLVQVNGLTLILDMGMYQGPREDARRINQTLAPDAAKADALILSHGHLDHCGKLPVLTRAGFKGPIYCTAATAEVARLVLEDSAKIQIENLQYLGHRLNAGSEPPAQPLYTPDDVPRVQRLFRTLDYGQTQDLGGGVSVTFYDAGHILGSAYVLLQWSEGGRPRKLLFTGDVGRYDAPILCDPQPLPGPVDLLITESTYGNVSHGPMANVGPQLLACVKEAIDKEGRLLIPSFAVGRTQDILWYMQEFVRSKQIPPIPVFVDSPMGVEMTRITDRFANLFDDQMRQRLGEKGLCGYEWVTLASTTDESKQINREQGTCVIIASSPTCEFGRILHHLRLSVERPQDQVVFVGWIPPGTLGRRLQDGESRVRVLDRWYDLRCQVKTIHGLSAHADGDELLRFLAPTLGPQTTAFVVHGEVDQSEAFAARLVGKGLERAMVPAMETSVMEFSSANPAAKGAPTQSNRTREEGE